MKELERTSEELNDLREAACGGKTKNKDNKQLKPRPQRTSSKIMDFGGNRRMFQHQQDKTKMNRMLKKTKTLSRSLMQGISTSKALTDSENSVSISDEDSKSDKNLTSRDQSDSAPRRPSMLANIFSKIIGSP